MLRRCVSWGGLGRCEQDRLLGCRRA
jgi:hypothetical protein